MAKNQEFGGIDIFSEKNEVQPQSINWGKVGDNVFGIKVSQRDGVKTKFGDNCIFGIMADGGFFHDKSGVKVEIKKGEIWDVWGRGDIFDGQMKRLQMGQKFGLKFVESKPSTMGNDAKIIKLFTTGEIDTTYLESLAGMGA